MKNPCVYILTNKRDGTLYTGMTTDIWKRTSQHQQISTGFTAKYNCHRLVYIEFCESVESAYLREKQIKGGSRAKKIALIESINPEWEDLTGQLPY